MSVARTCPARRSLTVSNGTSGSRAVATPALVRKFEATFDSYWLDDAFVSYDPDRDADRLDDALRIAGGGGRTDNGAISLAGLEVAPARISWRSSKHWRRNALATATATSSSQRLARGRRSSLPSTTGTFGMRRSATSASCSSRTARRSSSSRDGRIARSLPTAHSARCTPMACARAVAARLRLGAGTRSVRSRPHRSRAVRRGRHRRVPPRWAQVRTRSCSTTFSRKNCSD